MKKKFKIIVAVAFVAAFLVPATLLATNISNLNNTSKVCTVDPPSVWH